MKQSSKRWGFVRRLLRSARHDRARNDWGLDWIVPWACPACEKWSNPRDFCSCGRLLRRADPSWQKVPLRHSGANASLPVYSLWKYTPPARKLLHRIKYRREPYWLKAFLSIKDDGVPWTFEKSSLELVCVPTRFMGWLSRGFHLPHLLAKDLARTYSLPYRKDLLCRKIFSRPQVGLGKRARAENVIGKFQIRKRVNLTGVNLLLVDDVMTTGSTLAECAEVLLEEGAASVTAWTLLQAVTGQTRK